MVGCPAEDSKASLIREVVSLMGAPKKINLCGQLGNGIAAKISNNYLSGIFLLAISEAYATGIRSGLEPEVLHSVITNSSGNSWLGENMPPVPSLNPDAPSSNGYKPGFTYQLLLKDIGLGIDAAKEQGIQPTMAEAARDVFKKASENPTCEVSLMFLVHRLHSNE